MFLNKLAHFDDSPNYGHDSQNSGYAQTNQINYDQSSGYPPNQAFNRPVNDGYSDGYGADNYGNCCSLNLIRFTDSFLFLSLKITERLEKETNPSVK